jgi:medium-chain acyl-[acyl-carrier-protein] hydrolase
MPINTNYRKMPIASNFTSVLVKEFEINFTQCASNGFLKYTELCNILQLTAASHSELGGISFSDMQEFNQAWVLSKMRLEIATLPKWSDKITVTTWINSLENSRSVRALEVRLNGKKIAGSETFWAVFNTKTRKPEALALPYSHFELFPERKAINTGFCKINLNDAIHEIAEKTVVLSDLDIVNHVNNVKYLEWCLDSLDAQKILKQKLKSLDMNFLKELSLQDPIQIYQSNTEKQTVFKITKEDKNSFGLQLNW